MKFTVKCLVNSVNANALSEAESTTKEVEVQNPSALLSSLRAKASVAFRLNPSAFSILYKGPRTEEVNLSDERVALSACGLQDGDNIVLVSKRVREDNGCEAPDAEGAAEQRGKTARVEGGGSSSTGVDPLPADAGADDFASASASLSSGASGAADFPDDDNEMIEEEGEIDIDLNAMAIASLLGEGSDASAGELYSRLIETVPDLVAMRQDFLANPQAVMERIQREDPTLFQLVTEHQQAFVELINNEDVIRTIQAEKEGEFFGDDEELDEEAMESLMGMLGGDGDDDDDYSDDGAELAGGELGVDLDALPLGGSSEDSKKRILDYQPSEEDEQKIQQLVQLGFAYDVCKVAFYMSLRSIDRAANLLFENPPQV